MNFVWLTKSNRAAQIIPSMSRDNDISAKIPLLSRLLWKIQFRADATNGNPTCEIETVARNAHKTVTEKKKKRKAHRSLSIHKLLCQTWFQYVERKYERERERKREGRRRERQCELRVAWIKWRSRVRGTNAFNVNPNISLSTWKKKCRQRA